MFPLFPTLRPPVANRLWFEIGLIVNEEAEVMSQEQQHHDWLESFKTIAADIHPLGKTMQAMPGPETDDDANDDSDDTDSHDDDDDDTNDRVIPGQPERSALSLYTPADDVNVNNTDDATNNSMGEA